MLQPCNRFVSVTDRVWVVVGSAEPVRVYLFNGGVLPFGSLKEEGAAVGKGDDTCSAGAHQQCSQQRDAGDDLIVNLWRNRGEAVIWSVDDFRQHLGEVTGSSTAFDRLWAAIQQKIGVFSPALGHNGSKFRILWVTS